MTTASPTFAFVESFLTALTDVIKHEIMTRINTGDRTRDNCIIALILVVLSYVMKILISGEVNSLYIEYKLKKISKLDTELAIFITEHDFKKIKVNAFLTETNIEINHPEFLAKVCQLHELLYNKSFNYTLDSNQELVQKYLKFRSVEDVGAWLNKRYITYCNATYGNNKTGIPAPYRFAIYANHGQFEFISASHTSYPNPLISITLTSSAIVPEFMKYVNSLMLTTAEPISMTSTLIVYNKETTAVLRRDRNMRMYVSKHKKKIVYMLDRFLSKKPTLGGYGSLNLGIMLYGEPGTGKTLLMKAIANYLNRSIRIIDMRTIKTREQFTNLFKHTDDDKVNYQKLVYVLDEFDCIKGIISNRSNMLSESNITPVNSEIKELKARRLHLLQVPTAGENKDNINAELAKIDKEISDIDDSLTLDTLLTTLDGVIEHTGRVIIAATNHIDQIDPALIREGRFDIKIKLERFDEDETKELLNVMFHDAPAKDLARLAKAKLVSGIYTPAQLVNMASECGKLSDMLNMLCKKNV